jgi:pyruvate formate lyase activating enzyme
MLSGTIFNIQRFSIQDGPGIRTTVFMKGCPLWCPWCSNPESQSSFPEIAHRDSLCNKCGRCIEVCAAQAISLTDNGVKIDRETCTGCGKCIEVCIPGALKCYGEEMSIEEVYREAIRDTPFYQDSGGGVTAGGGEPLSQADFVAGLFKRCQDSGINTCLDTCGYAAPSAWKKVLPHTNLVLFDVKLMEPSAHRRVTGKSNEKILQNLELVAASGVPVIVRIPLITGINDSRENITDTARYVANINGLKEINLLPYHRFGESKYAMLDRQYSLSELTTPQNSHIEELVNIVKSFGLECQIVV